MGFKSVYTVFGSESEPRIQFYHEIVSPRNERSEGEEFLGVHTQDYFEFSFFIAGKRDIKVGDRVYDFKAGEIFLASPEEEHAGGLSHGELDRYRLHIWPSALCAFPAGNGLDCIFKREKYKGNRITLTEQQQKSVYACLTSIDNSVKLGHPGTRNLSAFADILKLLVLLSELIEKRDAAVTPHSKLLLDVLSFIESSYDSVTVGQIENHFSLGHATLWRLFSRELSVSPSAYILDIKLKKAKMMLSQGFDVQTASDQSGFCDCSYFIKRFKQKYGETPLRLKKETTEETV